MQVTLHAPRQVVLLQTHRTAFYHTDTCVWQVYGNRCQEAESVQCSSQPAMIAGSIKAFISIKQPLSKTETWFRPIYSTVFNGLTKKKKSKAHVHAKMSGHMILELICNEQNVIPKQRSTYLTTGGDLQPHLWIIIPECCKTCRFFSFWSLGNKPW